MENCSEAGFLFLELYGSDEDNAELARKVAVIPGIKSKLVILEQEEE